MPVSENSDIKCVSVNLPFRLVNQINNYKARIGKSQNSVLVELIKKGLSTVNKDTDEIKNYYFVKIRIDTAKMMEMGQKLQSGELDTSSIIMTYCIKDDPTIGLNIWQSKDRESFEYIFAQHKKYYKEVLEIIPVTTPAEAMKMILENFG